MNVSETQRVHVDWIKLGSMAGNCFDDVGRVSKKLGIVQQTT